MSRIQRGSLSYRTLGLVAQTSEPVSPHAAIRAVTNLTTGPLTEWALIHVFGFRLTQTSPEYQHVHNQTRVWEHAFKQKCIGFITFAHIQWHVCFSVAMAEAKRRHLCCFHFNLKSHQTRLKSETVLSTLLIIHVWLDNYLFNAIKWSRNTVWYSVI